jgi:hypothetical protein
MRQPFPGRGGREVISADAGIEPVRSRTGREIFVRSMDGRQVMGVDVRTEPSFAAGTPRIHLPVGLRFSAAATD